MARFKVKFDCMNCGNVWEQEFGKKIHVENETFGKVYVRYDGCKGGKECKCHYVKCPVCELENHIRVLEREPLINKATEEVKSVVIKAISELFYRDEHGNYSIDKRKLAEEGLENEPVNWLALFQNKDSIEILKKNNGYMVIIPEASPDVSRFHEWLYYKLKDYEGIKIVTEW